MGKKSNKDAYKSALKKARVGSKLIKKALKESDLNIDDGYGKLAICRAVEWAIQACVPGAHVDIEIERI
ncbi:MAG: hypothetical protein ABIH66_03100 [bacterium]